MSQFKALLSENGIKTLEKAVKNTPKTSVGRELINNLLYRLERRGNLMVKMEGHFVKEVQIKLASNFFAPKERNYAIWVKPFIRNNKLFFNHGGVVLRAADIFGNGINVVKI
jgi:hypothetical protein